jgi:hypothetical protein
MDIFSAMRSLLILCLIGCVCVGHESATAEETVVIAGTLRNREGEALPHITVRASRRVAAGWHTLATETGLDGMFLMAVPKDRWVVMADADELVARGYFCVPGFIVGGPLDDCGMAELPRGVPPSPLGCGTWGQPIILEAVPSRPELAVSKSPGESAVVHMTYPWTTVQMITVRRYVLEKSTDMVNWEPVSTVSLEGYGRLDVEIPGSHTQPCCVFRAVETTPLTVEVVLPD